MNTIKRFAFILVLASSLVGVGVAAAQGQLSLSISRDFGYGGFDNRIQGRFSLRVDGPDDLAMVDYHIDNELIGTENETPFRHQFSTDNFAPGEHSLYAVGYTSAGEELRSNEIVRVFITAAEVRGTITTGVLPLVGVTLAIIAGATLLPLLLSRGQGHFELGQYGMAGGAVCKRCGLPFSRHVWMPNLVLGRLESCPHCGKISIVPRAPANALEEAEQRYRQQEASGGPAESDQRAEERLRRQIDNSRYED